MMRHTRGREFMSSRAAQTARELTMTTTSTGVSSAEDSGRYNDCAVVYAVSSAFEDVIPPVSLGWLLRYRLEQPR